MSFDAVAPFYDYLVRLVFGQRLQRAQAAFLDQVPNGASVLIVGGGTGQILSPLLTRNPAGRVLYLESSARMLARAGERMVSQLRPGTVEFRLGNETALRTDETFDVLLTPFVLDLFTEDTLRTGLIPRLNSALRPGGLWLVTDFVPTRVGWQRTLLWTMIRFFRLTAGIETRQLADWPRLLTEAGLMLRERRTFVGGLVSAEIRQGL